MSVTFEELMPEINPGHARTFIEEWLGGLDGFTVVTRISSTGRHVVRSWAFSVEQLLESLTPEMAVLSADEGGMWNVYVGCSMHEEDPTHGGSRRGGRRTIGGVHGVWLDLDVKDESFADGDAIDAFLVKLGVEPTLIVNSGSGGRHAYWRFSGGPVPRDEGEMLNEAWWAHAQEVAGDVYVDKVATADRIMRLPGTIRWPKETGELPSLVTLLRVGERVSKESLWETSQPAYERLGSRRGEVRDRVERTSDLANVRLEDIAHLTGWDQLLAMAHLEDLFNEQTTWDEILVPHGWKVVGSDYEGRRHWARPGQHGKSAHTDYPPSPHVMKLFSNSPATGLSHLSDADVALTKFRVHVELAYAGNAKACVEAIVKGIEA